MLKGNMSSAWAANSGSAARATSSSFRDVRSTRDGSSEDNEAIDFFAPPRDDFLLGGKPAYMRRLNENGRRN